MKTFLACVTTVVLLMVLTEAGFAKPVPGFQYRTPKSEKELRFWLENMVWHHGFSRDEIRAATGLSKARIDEALRRYDIRAETRPAPARRSRLRILPWPGGRELTNWGGEVERSRQRETKATVFAPWDRTSYAVLDLPEAIWSNLGLVYLAHVDVPTIWTRRKINLDKLEWNRRPDGGLDLVRKLPNGIAYKAVLLPFRRSVRMKLTLINGTESTLSKLRVQNCVMLKGLKGFQNEDRPRLAASGPYNARGTADGKRWIVTAWVPEANIWGNPRNPCFHSDPKFQDCPPGESRSVYGWLSFYEGDDIKGEFRRIDKTGWRSDRWQEKPGRGADSAK